MRAGETHEGAAAEVGCSAKSVQRLLAKTGGVKSRAKPRSPLRLSLAEREEISRGLLAGESRLALAARLGRSPSTVTREVAAASGLNSYRAWRADDECGAHTIRVDRDRQSTLPGVVEPHRCEPEGSP